MKDIGIIDIEASGLHFDAYPIEIAVRLSGECRSWLIKPEPQWQCWCATADEFYLFLSNQVKRVPSILKK